MIQKGASPLPLYHPNHHRYCSSSPPPSSSSAASFSSSQSTLVSSVTSPSLGNSACINSSSEPKHKHSDDNNYHSINSPCSSRSWMSRQRITMTASRTILLVLILFMMVSVLHLHYFHQSPAREATTPSPSSSSSTMAPQDSVSDTIPSSAIVRPINKSDIFNDPTVQSMTETTLTRTIEYTNGKILKTYKPQFWNQPELAKQELGSFLDTLSRRSQAAVETRALEVLSSALAAGPDGDFMEPLLQDLDQERYFGFLPMGGGNNQFVTLQKAAVMAKRTGRTLVLPPISPSTHIKTWDGRPYSEFYDIPGFIRDSGIRVVEWHEIKHVPSDGHDGYALPKSFKSHWIDFAEDFPCQVTGNIGKDNLNLYDRFRNQYLLKFVAANVPEDTSQGNATEFAYAERVLLRNNGASKGSNAATTLGKNKNANKTLRELLAPLPRDELWQCLSSPYFLSMDQETGPMLWSDVGRHLRFHPRLEAMTDLLLRHILLGEPLDRQQLLSPNLGVSSQGQPPRQRQQQPVMPEFMIVHLRRGDIVTKCHGLPEEQCLVQIEAIADKIAQLELQRKQRWSDPTKPYSPLPVLVTTNEQRESELAKLDRLGWIRVDHSDPERVENEQGEQEGEKQETKPKTIRLGTESLLGPFYPSILDGILLTKGRYMIGMRNSKMSQLAATRGHEWYGHQTLLMVGTGMVDAGI